MYLQLYTHRKKCVPPERQAGWDESLSSVEDSFVLIKFRVTINEVINTTAPDVYKAKWKQSRSPAWVMGRWRGCMRKQWKLQQYGQMSQITLGKEQLFHFSISKLSAPYIMLPRKQKYEMPSGFSTWKNYSLLTVFALLIPLSFIRKAFASVSESWGQDCPTNWQNLREELDLQFYSDG